MTARSGRCALLAGIAVLVFGVGTPAGAANTTRLAGPVEIVDRFTFGDGCDFVHGVWDGTFAPNPGRPWTVHVDECTEQLPSGLLHLSGDFSLVSPGGSLFGTITATAPFGSGDYDVDITGGTRRFDGATGSLALHGSWDTSTFGAFEFDGTLTGTLSR